MSEEHSHRILATGAISLATVFWGFNYIGTKYALFEIDSMPLLFLRVTAAALLAMIITRMIGRDLLPTLKHWKKILPLSAFSILGGQLTFLIGMKLTTASHGVILFTLAPIFTGVIASIVLKERMSIQLVSGIIIGLAGALLLVTEKGVTFASEYFLGDLFILAAAICWAFYAVFSRRVVPVVGTRRTATLTFMLGWPLVLPFCLVPALQFDWGAVSWKGWAGAGYLVVFGTVIVVYLFSFALKHLSSTYVSAFVYGQPVIATLAAYLMLDEELTVRFFISALLVLTGLLISTFRPKVATSAPVV